jgi:hypothetical protein
MSGYAGRPGWDLDEALRNQASPAPLWHEPVRAAAGLSAAVIVASAFLPFAVGHVPDARGALEPMSWSGFEGAGDGAILLFLALIAGFLALNRGVAESPTQLAQFAPLIVATLIVFTALNALREASAAVANWKQSNGDGALGPGMLASLVAAFVLLASAAWLAITRYRRATDPSDQWRLSVRDVAEGVGAAIGGIGGFWGALVLSSSLLHAMYAPLMILASLVGALGGIWLGARLGVALVARIRRS